MNCEDSKKNSFAEWPNHSAWPWYSIHFDTKGGVMSWRVKSKKELHLLRVRFLLVKGCYMIHGWSGWIYVGIKTWKRTAPNCNNFSFWPIHVPMGLCLRLTFGKCGRYGWWPWQLRQRLAGETMVGPWTRRVKHHVEIWENSQTSLNIARLYPRYLQNSSWLMVSHIFPFLQPQDRKLWNRGSTCPYNELNGFYKPTHFFRSGWRHRLCLWCKFAAVKTTSSQDPQPDSGTDLQKELDEVAARVFFGRVGVHLQELIVSPV